MEFSKYLFIFKNLNLRFLRFFRNFVFFLISVYLYGFFFPNLVFTIILRFFNLLNFWVDFYGLSFYFHRIFNLVSYWYIFLEWVHSYLSDKFSFYQIFSNFLINFYNSSLDFIFSFNFFLFFVAIFFLLFCIYFFFNLVFIIYIFSKRFFNFFLFFSEYYYYKKEDLVLKSSFSNLIKFLLWLEQQEISNKPKELIFKSTQAHTQAHTQAQPGAGLQELNKFDWSNVYFLFYAYQNWQDLEKEDMDSVLEDDVLTLFDTNKGPYESLDYSEEEETAEQDLEFPVWFLFVNDKEFDLNYLELHEDLDDPIYRHKIYPSIFSKNLNLFWFNKIPKWFFDFIFIKESFFFELFNFFIYSSPFLYKLNKGLRILRLWLNLIYWDWLYVFKYFPKSSWLILYAKLKKKLFLPLQFISYHFKNFYYRIRKIIVYLCIYLKKFIILITNFLVLIFFILLGFLYTYILFIYFFFKNLLLTILRTILNIFSGFRSRSLFTLRSIFITYIKLIYVLLIYPVWFIFTVVFIILCITLIFIFICLYYIVFRVIKLLKYVFSILDYFYDRGYLKNEVKKLLYEKPIFESVYKICRIVVSKIVKTKIVYSLKRSGWCRKGNYLERNKIYQTVSIDLVKIEAPLKLIKAPQPEQNKVR